jgi:hypothetical protein
MPPSTFLLKKNPFQVEQQKKSEKVTTEAPKKEEKVDGEKQKNETHKCICIYIYIYIYLYMYIFVSTHIEEAQQHASLN